MFERIAYNLLQVFVVVAFAPLVEGVTSRLKENLQSKLSTRATPLRRGRIQTCCPINSKVNWIISHSL